MTLNKINFNALRRYILTPLALWLIIVPLAIAVPKTEHWVNNAGVPVYYVYVPQIPMVDIALRFDAGSTRNSDKKSGLAALTARMMKQGAGKLTLEQIIEKSDELGSIYGTGASRDFADLTMRSLSDQEIMNKALDLFTIIISQPNFPDKHFQRIKKSMLSGIAARGQSVGSVTGSAFNKLLYGDHPYGRESGGTHETVSALTRQDVKNFYEKYYVYSNMIVAMIGDISRARAEEIANHLTHSFQPGVKPDPIPSVKPLEKGVVKRVDFPSEQVHVKIGQPLMKVGDSDFHAFFLGNHILGGSGFGSRLLEEIRVKRGLAYSSSSRFRTRRELGPFFISFQTRADQEELARSVANEVLLDFIKNGPSEAEINLSRSSILGRLPVNNASNSSILNTVRRNAFYGLPIYYLDRFKERIEGVRKEDIIQAFQRLHPDKMVTVIGGGGNNLP